MTNKFIILFTVDIFINLCVHILYKIKECQGIVKSKLIIKLGLESSAKLSSVSLNIACIQNRIHSAVDVRLISAVQGRLLCSHAFSEKPN